MRALAMLALGGILLLPPLVPEALAQSEGASTSPVFTVGDFFEVRDRIGEPSGATQDRVIRQTVEAIESVTLGDVTYDAVRMRMTFLGGAETYVEVPGSSMLTWVRASDGAELRSEQEMPGEGRTVRSYAEPCVFLQHPLVVGATWTSRCTLTTTHTRPDGTTSSSSETRTTVHRVLGRETVTVPAGTFEAFRLESNTTENPFDVQPQQHWYAPDACVTVKTISVQRGGYSDTYELLAHRCAAKGGMEDAPLPMPLWIALVSGLVALAFARSSTRRRRRLPPR